MANETRPQKIILQTKRPDDNRGEKQTTPVRPKNEDESYSVKRRIRSCRRITLHHTENSVAIDDGW